MKKLAAAAGIVAGLGFAVPVTAQTNSAIPIIVKDTTSGYWQAVLTGARKAGQDLGVKVLELGAQSESDIPSQTSILQNAVAARPAAIVIAPGLSSALGKSLDEAAKTVKIVGIDTAADSRALTSLLTADNVKAGRMAADVLAGAITRTYGDTEGDVAIVATSHDGASLDQSTTGFREQAGAKYRALNVLPEKVADAQAAAGLAIMKDLLAADRDLRGLFVSNTAMARGAVQAVAENKTGDKINVVVLGADNELVKGLKDGTVAALLVQDPFRIGYDAIKTALAASKGEQVSTHIDTDANLITKANINLARSQELLGYITK